MANTPITKRVRKSLNLTQAEFAAKLKVHPMTISKWERGVEKPGKARVKEIRFMERVMPREEVKAGQ